MYPIPNDFRSCSNTKKLKIEDGAILVPLKVYTRRHRNCQRQHKLQSCCILERAMLGSETREPKIDKELEIYVDTSQRALTSERDASYTLLSILYRMLRIHLHS